MNRNVILKEVLEKPWLEIREHVREPTLWSREQIFVSKKDVQIIHSYTEIVINIKINSSNKMVQMRVILLITMLLLSMLLGMTETARNSRVVKTRQGPIQAKINVASKL